MIMTDRASEMNAKSEFDLDCTNPSCARVRAERDSLLASIRDLTHAQLIGRDIELGLRAELMQSRIDMDEVRDRSRHDLFITRRSATWRVGSLILGPVSGGKRMLRRLKNRLR